MKNGTVRWFDPVKGYGFIVGDDGKDAFVHQSNILKKGFRALEVGQRVECFKTTWTSEVEREVLK